MVINNKIKGIQTKSVQGVRPKMSLRSHCAMCVHFSTPLSTKSQVILINRFIMHLTQVSIQEIIGVILFAIKTKSNIFLFVSIHTL